MSDCKWYYNAAIDYWIAGCTLNLYQHYNPQTMKYCCHCGKRMKEIEQPESSLLLIHPPESERYRIQ